jgi:hypothetical protein
MKEEGCETRAMSKECQHPACMCMATKKPGLNRDSDTLGVRSVNLREPALYE